MINLIPNKEKKKKVQDFYFRLVVIGFMVFSCCILAGAVLALPSYFLSSVKKNLSNTKLEVQKKEPIPAVDQSTLVSVDILNSKMNLIEKAETEKYPVSIKIVGEIMSRRMSDIKLTEIYYDNTAAAGKKIILRGIAPNRERLLLFRRALEEDPAFKKVDLPISNFVKDSNIEFSLNLIPA